MMKPTRSFLAFFLLASAATLSAQNADTGTTINPQSAFEENGPVDAKIFVPADMMTGTLHAVGEQAANNGFQNTYSLSCGGLTSEVTGTPALLNRIREIYALDYLRSLSKSEEFGRALKASAKEKGASIVSAAKDPVGTIKSLPLGASRFFGGIGEALKGGKSENEGGALDKISGTEKQKSQLAAKLGVSPYTTNEELQEELTSTARVMAGGGLILTAVSTAATGGVGAALTVIGVNQTLQQALVNSTPSELRILNRKKLFALGMDRDQADAFLMQPYYTPWVTTITTDALARIGVRPTAFLKEATKVDNQADAFYFQRLAQILAQYHETIAPLRSIRMEGGLICGVDRAGTLVVPVSLDYATWSERTARRADEFTAFFHDHKEIKALALWTDGRLSDRLGKELTNRNISWRMLALNADKPQTK